MNFIRNFSRILTGLVFIFSGFVKSVDPLGTAYKFEDYFLALHLEWLMSLSVVLAFLLIAAEFVIGWMLFFNIRTKINAWFVLGFMLLFTPLTLWLAITNKVTDCGCFGDFLVMTNFQTFLKNAVILVFVIILFAMRKSFVNKMAAWKQVLISLAGVVIVAFMMHTGYNHEPYFDFRPFYKGAHISENMLPTPEIAEVTLVFQHLETGEEMEYTTKTLPYTDSVLYPKLKFLRQEKKVIQPFQEAKTAFEILGPDGADMASEIIGSKDFLFVLVMQDVATASKNAFKKIVPLVQEAQRRKIGVVAITGSSYPEAEKFLAGKGIPLPHYSSDIIKLKTVVRANPGLLLLKNGYIIDKWHHHDIPNFKDLNIEGPLDAFVPAN